MLTEYYIEKDRKLIPSQDFQFLLKEGLKYIEQLGSKFWTDYNPHDPGITILDVLCYAITELGYRADFDIKDILTDKKGLIKNNTFFSAASIFTNAPLTEIDYRKLLIDIEGVANAWLIATKKTLDTNGYLAPNDSETKLYINKLEDKLSLKKVNKNNVLLPELALRGLNQVKIELDEDPILGDLNTLVLEHAFWVNNRWVSIKIVPQFTNWNHPDAQLFKKMNKPSKITIESVKKVQDIVYLIVNRYSKPTDSLHFRIFVEDASEIDLALDHFDNENNVCEIISLFEKKKDKIQTIFSEIQIKLHQNRNLAEDYLCTEIIEKVDIAICADIEIEAGADSIEVMSQIQIAIDRAISPKIYFYTLSQLVNEGYHSEDIFLGPRLSHGFLKDEEIEKAQLAKEIHASDIIAVLMEVKGVKSVRNVLMTAYNSLGKPIPNASNKSWVLALSGDIKPVFDAKKSKLLLFQKNIPFLLTENQLMLVEQKVILYKAQFNQKKLQNNKNDFEIENGDYFELKNYYSIQDEFPANYGLGKNYVSEKETNLRKSQVKQLKGYLFFYEQIIADFFSQLYNAKNLFDTKPLDQTYFPTYLEKDDLTGKEFYSKILYADSLKTKLLDGESLSDASLYETKAQFYDRRNRVLDHLIARFSESFNDYVFMMYRVSHDTMGMGGLSFDYEDLIEDKQKFINAYPEISSNRGLGIDYLNAEFVDLSLQFNPFWKTDHRGGYEKRVAKLLGINAISLRDIVTEDSPQKQWTVEIPDEYFLFKIVSPAINLQAKWDWAKDHFLDQNLYAIESYGTDFYLYLVDNNAKIAKLEKKFITKDEAFTYLEKMIQIFNELAQIDETLLGDIITEASPQPKWTVKIIKENFLFKIVSPAVNLQEKWDWAQLHFLDQNLYKIDNIGSNFYLYLVNDTKKVARLDKKFTTETEAYAYLQKMIKALNIYYENFYCLEHILLRPFKNSVFDDNDLLTVCLNDDCDDEANNDPYSFKATIVLPGYLSRFKSLIFRKYAEKIFRQEAPAHVLLKICWVNSEDMLGFQTKYKDWLENYRYYRLQFCENTVTPSAELKYKKSLNVLVAALKELNNIYPEGNLYDCQLSESKNPIILGNTSLGTL